MGTNVAPKYETNCSNICTMIATVQINLSFSAPPQARTSAGKFPTDLRAGTLAFAPPKALAEDKQSLLLKGRDITIYSSFRFILQTTFSKVIEMSVELISILYDSPEFSRALITVSLITIAIIIIILISILATSIMSQHYNAETSTLDTQRSTLNNIIIATARTASPNQEKRHPSRTIGEKRVVPLAEERVDTS
ncbi:hypothetical protein PoB_003440800 [Plakobranchus ocellatus]|uniref:Uncharacterized protein n=1 Tax=Plakobranchus ocellatus TaxID=259542 RepID=A0AAV4AMU7_9GAST|nr:hypothetical protein PoB_003440800 [Plakobranchus ocellatus]